VSYALQVIWKIPEELKKEAAILFSLPQCGKSMALSNPDYLPERVKIGIRCISPCPSKGFAVRSSPLLIRRAIATSEIHFPQRKAPPVDNLFTEGAFH
jgi:hypothetical protein